MLKSHKILFTRILIIVLAGSMMRQAYAQQADESGSISLNVRNERKDTDNKNIFIVYNTGVDMQEFKAYAKQMARLKSFGRVDICINSPAEKANFEVPSGCSDWHEYASYNRSVEVFYPDKKIAAFLPEDFVNKNRQLMLSKLSVIRELGLSAAFSSNEPRYLPEAFFEKYPHLRGPRVDHPRRSVQKEFAPCFHQKETIDIYRNMVNQLYKNAPEIHSFYFSMNDAGSGSCWGDWLYSGPNGPASCKNISKSEAVINMLNVYKDGAKQTGHDVDIYFKGMFTDEEMNDLVNKLPDNCFLEGRNFPPVKYISSMLHDAYPVSGIINPLQIIRTMSRTANNTPQRYMFDFWTSYSRAHERIETIEKIVDIVSENLLNPPGEGELNILEKLKKMCVKWAGEANAEQLFNAFIELDQSINESDAALRGLSTLYWGVSARQITRPLVFATQKLTHEEEKYFLPYVFNISLEEARNDYMDIHGGDRELTTGAVDNFLRRLKRVYTSIEMIHNAPEQKFLDDMAKSLRLYSCVLRSCGNFNDAQIIRNRNKALLASPVHRPNKIPTWTGDQDLLNFNKIMRDELDNTQEFIDLLENGGMDLVCHANAPFPEDTFVLGADLIDQLKQKRKIMLAHWQDIEGYLATPFK